MTYISQPTPFFDTVTVPSPGKIIGIIGKFLRELAVRRTLKTSLETLSEKNLRDIGLNKNDVQSITHLPMPASGASTLSAIGRSRVGNW